MLGHHFFASLTDNDWSYEHVFQPKVICLSGKVAFFTNCIGSGMLALVLADFWKVFFATWDLCHHNHFFIEYLLLKEVSTIAL